MYKYSHYGGISAALIVSLLKLTDMRSHSWTYLYLKQRAGGKKSAGNIAFGLLTKLLILFTVFVYGIMLGALIESGFITQSCSLLLGILLLFILDMILEEDPDSCFLF